MKNYVQDDDVITVAAPSGGAVSGVGYMVGNLFGIWTTSADATVDCEMITEGVFNIAKDDAAYSVGDAVYWDDQNNLAMDASFSASLTRIGVCVKAAVAGDTTVRVRLDGFVTRQSQL